jgi:hypothetical protein
MLRAIILVVGTGLLIYAAGLAVISLYNISRSPDSVVEETARVAPDDLVGAELPERPLPSDPNRSRENPQQRAAYERIARLYYSVFRVRFERYRQPDDQRLSYGDFNNRYVDTAARMAAVGRGDVNFDNDISDLTGLVRTVAAASLLPGTRQRLESYRNARRVQVCQNVQRTRISMEPGWNSYGTDCPNWYENLGCPTQRPVQTPYTARECSMRFPDGTQSHLQILRAYQDQFFRLLGERRVANAANAQQSRAAIRAANEQGQQDLWRAVTIVGSFLALMFFFLLIAIERHQRRLATEKGSA